MILASMVVNMLFRLLHLHGRFAAKTSAIDRFCLFQNSLFELSVRFVCNNTLSNQQSFTVSYLINTFGFSENAALSASNYIRFRTPKRPESVIAFLKSYGFLHTEISKMMRRCPGMIVCANPRKIWMPKLEFLQSIGLSSTDVMKILSLNPEFLRRSLDNHIIPNFKFLKTVLHSNEKIVFAFKRYQGILDDNFKSKAEPKVAILRESGVPEQNIVSFIANYPRVFMAKTDDFRETLERLKNMGFNPLKQSFVQAAHAMRAMKNSTWERKIEIYKNWGLSEDEILAAFRRNPWCMTKSEEKIKEVMDFLVNALGWDASVVIRSPMALSSSFETKLVPRCSVIQELLSKGLIKRDFSLRKFIMLTDEKFLQKLETTYKEEAPRLLQLYHEKMKSQSKLDEEAAMIMNVQRSAFCELVNGPLSGDHLALRCSRSDSII